MKKLTLIILAMVLLSSVAFAEILIPFTDICILDCAAEQPIDKPIDIQPVNETYLLDGSKLLDRGDLKIIQSKRNISIISKAKISLFELKEKGDIEIGFMDNIGYNNYSIPNVKEIKGDLFVTDYVPCTVDTPVIFNGVRQTRDTTCPFGMRENFSLSTFINYSYDEKTQQVTVFFIDGHDPTITTDFDSGTMEGVTLVNNSLEGNCVDVSSTPYKYALFHVGVDTSLWGDFNVDDDFTANCTGTYCLALGLNQGNTENCIATQIVSYQIQLNATSDVSVNASLGILRSGTTNTVFAVKNLTDNNYIDILGTPASTNYLIRNNTWNTNFVGLSSGTYNVSFKVNKSSGTQFVNTKNFIDDINIVITETGGGSSSDDYITITLDKNITGITSIWSNASCLGNCSGAYYQFYNNTNMLYNNTDNYYNWTGLLNNTAYSGLHWNVSYNSTLKNNTADFSITTSQTVQTPASNLSSVDNSCEGDRSCCSIFSNSLNYICFRNDTDNLVGKNITEELIITNNSGVSTFVGNNMMSYKDSIWYTKKTGSITSGIDLVYVKEGVGAVLTPFSISGEGGKYEWSPALKKTNSGQDFSVGLIVEAEQGFIGTETILWKGKINKFTDITKNATFTGSLSGTPVSYSIIYSTAIDGAYPGFYINITRSCTSFCNKTFNFQFIVAFNETPTSYTVSGTSFNTMYHFTSVGENKTITAVWTDLANETQISDWFGNPEPYYNNTKTAITQDFNKFTYPTYIQSDSDLLRAYYQNIWGILWFSFVKMPPKYGFSNYYNYTALYPAASKYYGIFAGDVPRICMGLLKSTTNQQIIDRCKEPYYIWQLNNYTESFVGSVRDSWKDTGYNHPFTTVVAWQIYQADGNVSFLQKFYPSLVADMMRRYNNRRDSNGLYYCSGGECGDGRSLAVAIDMNSEMYLAWTSLANIATELNYTTDAANWTNRSQFLVGKTSYFWDNTEKYFFDLSKDSTSKDYDPYEKGTGWAWSFAFANISEVVNNSDYAMGLNNSIYNSSRYGTEYIVPDIPANSASYTGDCGLWWCGNAWSIIAWRAVLGLHNWGYETDANFIRNKTLNMIADFHTGTEWYDSDNNGDVNGNVPLYGWSMSNFLFLANSNSLGVTVTVTPPDSGNGTDTTVPTLVIDSPIATTYSSNQIYVSFTASDDVAVDSTWFSNGTINFTYINATTINVSEGSYTFYFYANDTSGNLGSGSVSFQVNLTEPAIAPYNWTQIYNNAMTDYYNYMGVLHWSVEAQLYSDTPKFVESLIDMYRATNNTWYLDKANVYLTNLSNRSSEWTAMTGGDFRVGHLAGIMAKFAYYAEASSNTTLQNRGSFFENLSINSVLPIIDPYYTNFTYNGTNPNYFGLRMGLLWETYMTKPMNQNYGYTVANAYLGRLGHTDRAQLATELSRALIAMTWTESCAYNSSKICRFHPYRGQFNVSGEVMSGNEYGLYPTKSPTQYYTQESEAFAVLTELSYINTSFVNEIANTYYYESYAQEGGLSNTLMWKDEDPPSTSFSNWHGYYKTHYYDKMPYYQIYIPNITNVSESILIYLEDWVSNNGSYTNYYTKPYQTITDPLSNQTSSITGAVDIVPSNFVKMISSYLLGQTINGSEPLASDPFVYLSISLDKNITGINSTWLNFTISGNATNWTLYYNNSGTWQAIFNSTNITTIEFNKTGLTNNTWYDFQGNASYNSTVMNSTGIFSVNTSQTVQVVVSPQPSGGGGGGIVFVNDTTPDNSTPSPTIPNVDLTLIQDILGNISSGNITELGQTTTQEKKIIFSFEKLFSNINLPIEITQLDFTNLNYDVFGLSNGFNNLKAKAESIFSFEQPNTALNIVNSAGETVKANLNTINLGTLTDSLPKIEYVVLIVIGILIIYQIFSMTLGKVMGL